MYTAAQLILNEIAIRWGFIDNWKSGKIPRGASLSQWLTMSTMKRNIIDRKKTEQMEMGMDKNSQKEYREKIKPSKLWYKLRDFIL